LKNNVINITIRSITISAEKFGQLKRKGIEIGNSDLLIAGLALENDLILVTNNEKHFNYIDNLIIDNWTK
jgi:tRNA(fMet)-specific endonuclease VapC